MASAGARVWGPGPTLADSSGTLPRLRTEAVRSRPEAQLSSSHVEAPGPGDFLRSVQKIPREGRKVAVNDLSS